MGIDGLGQSKERLTGWKAIADHFGRGQSTVRRWATTRDLPIHHAAGDRGASVYAYPHELDGWLTRNRAAALDDESILEPVAGDDPDEELSPVPVDTSILRPQSRRKLLWGISAAVALIGGGSAFWVLSSGENSSAVRAENLVPPEARELYLHGTYLWNRRTPQGIAGAIETLTRALEIHPDYPEAHASLAMTYNLARQYSDMAGWEAYAKAERHARRAVELDPRLAFGQAVLAFVEFHWLWQVEAGLARFEQALQLNPNDANALMWYASSLIFVDRPQHALTIIDRAQELDPSNTTILNMKAQALFYSGRREEGYALMEQLIARDPGHAWNHFALGLFRLAQGDHAGYLEKYATLGDMIGVPRHRVVAEAGMAALDLGGIEAMAAAMVAEDTRFFERGQALAWDVAGHHAIVGNWREAIPWLRISLERREERLIGLKGDVTFRPIRHLPEYRQLLADIGLPVDN